MITITPTVEAEFYLCELCPASLPEDADLQGLGWHGGTWCECSTHCPGCAEEATGFGWLCTYGE